MTTFGEALVPWARRDLGLIEAAPNAGPRINEMLERFGHPPGTNWCGAATGTWIQELAEHLKLPYPVQGTALAKGFREQFKAIGRWHEADELRADPSLLKVGDVVVWHRGVIGAQTGHVGPATKPVGRDRMFESIEGNTGTKGTGGGSGGVFLVPHSIDDPMLYGAGSLDIPIAGTAAGIVPSKVSHIPWLVAAAVVAYYATPRLTK